MRILLNNRQIEQLRPYFDRVRANAQLGSPGMLVAQIHRDEDEGDYWIEPAFLEHEHAQVITGHGVTRIPGNIRQQLTLAEREPTDVEPQRK